jgi:hypothetical protein
MRTALRLVVATALLLALVSGSPTVLAQSRVQPSLFAPAQPSVNVVVGRAAQARQAAATAQLLKAPSLAQAAAKPADLPAVLCGMTLIPGDPAIDSKIQRPAPADGRQFTMRTVVPKICQP